MADRAMNREEAASVVELLQRLFPTHKGDPMPLGPDEAGLWRRELSAYPKDTAEEAVRRYRATTSRIRPVIAAVTAIARQVRAERLREARPASSLRPGQWTAESERAAREACIRDRQRRLVWALGLSDDELEGLRDSFAATGSLSRMLMTDPSRRAEAERWARADRTRALEAAARGETYTPPERNELLTAARLRSGRHDFALGLLHGHAATLEGVAP